MFTLVEKRRDLIGLRIKKFSGNTPLNFSRFKPKASIIKITNKASFGVLDD